MRKVVLLVGLTFLGFLACNRSPDATLRRGTLAFEITQLPPIDEVTEAWFAIYGTDNPQRLFEIGLRVVEASPDSSFALSWGTFRRLISNGNGEAFLQDLATALGASDVRGSPSPADSLEFAVALFGTRLTRGPGDNIIAGEFTSDRLGAWIVGKLFLADGEAEVYMALNPVLGQGEFIMKDPEYADAVVQELARLF